MVKNRYSPDGYKLTEIGVMPAAWEAKRLGDALSQPKLGGNYPNSETVTKHPLIKMGNVARGHIALGKVEYIVEGVLPSKEHRLVYGDVLFNTRNTLDLVGKVAIWRNELSEAYYNSNLLRLDFCDSYISSPFFLNYCLNARSSIAQLRNIATGTTSVAAIYSRDLVRLIIPIPPPQEQQAIATALTDTDNLIASLEKLIDKKRKIKLGTMQELLTGRMRLPHFGGKWGVHEIGELLRVCHGRSQRMVEDATGSYPILASGGQIGWSKEYLHDKPSVLIGRKGTIDKPQYIQEPFWTIDTLFYTDIYYNADAKYLYYLFGTIEWYSYNEASGVPSLSARTIERIRVTMPSLVEQRAIAQVLSNIDSEIEALEQRLSKLKDIKRGMMQELLTGRIRLV